MATRSPLARAVWWLGMTLLSVIAAGPVCASCGDYVHVAGREGLRAAIGSSPHQLPANPVAHQDSDGAAGDHWSGPLPPNAPPCQGPQCRPQRRLPTSPNEPLTAERAADEAVAGEHLGVPADMAGAQSWPVPIPFADAPPGRRRERPPRLAG